MANFFNISRKFALNSIDLKEIVDELEDQYSEKDELGPLSFEDAMEWYGLLLDNAGKIAAQYIWPRAGEVDEEGASFENGDVAWSEKTIENMKVLADAGYMGGTLERKYGGLNLPDVINTIIIEMISQGDASLMNLFGLQDIAVTIQKFGTDEQRERILPKFASGEVSGAMALTEPDSGSDLQKVKLKAVEKDGEWYLDGVKHFITNGNAEIHLVLARTEKDIPDGRGLSMMLYKKDENLVVRRIENKLGIHGSPTCELHYKMAKCELVGKRRFGLVKYMMSLLNGARLATSAQALGIAQAAYEEAVKYSNEREQFGEKIVNFPAVYQMIADMETDIEAARLLLYRTAYSVDLHNMYEKKLANGENVRSEFKEAGTLAGFLTPLSKFVCTEMANRVAYDSLQVHGGVGYIKEFPIERLYRDARITNIYEGTTQLQVVAAIGGITSGFFFRFLNSEYEKTDNKLEVEKIKKKAKTFSLLVDKVKDIDSKEFLKYVSNYLVEIASLIFCSLLLAQQLKTSERIVRIFRYFDLRSDRKINYLTELTSSLLFEYGKDISVLKKDFQKGH